MKKFAAAAMAAVLALSVSVPSFAATTTTLKMESFTGAPINEEGRQESSTSNSIEPNQTIYYMLPATAATYLNNSKSVKLSVKKTTNSKLIKSVKLVEKKLTNSGSTIWFPQVAAPIGLMDTTNLTNYGFTSSADRHVYLAVELNDYTSPDEMKVEFTATFTARKAITDIFYGSGSASIFGASTVANKYNTGDRIDLKASMWVANKTTTGDSSITVGKNGMTVKPISNEDNEVIFEGDETFATLKFRANSNAAKFYAKLTTKWTNAELAKFENTDAVIRKFNPATIDSTSRATLYLNNPYYEDDVSPEDIYIYSIASNGTITDVTSKFTYDSDEDAFYTPTRTLGTWVISNVKVKTK